jgi:hypothetical protein
MQHCSTSVGALAAALAKAQVAIANPEKSLTANIVSPFPREGCRTFRYAPLSLGLDLVRKCLGQHEIATVQTTAVDRESGLIRLTTTLVHASGEWVSSDWPVCPVSETAAPHRLGAALTYARRYALFTLVGIAGEDDLDAPDLLPAHGAPVSTDRRLTADERAAGTNNSPIGQSTGRALRRRASAEKPRPITLPSDASNDLRCHLISELKQLVGSEALADWAQRALPLKDQLAKADARAVEEAFSARLSEPGALEPTGPKDRKPKRPDDQPSHADLGQQPVTIIGKPVRERDREHLKFVASQPCLVCGRLPSDAHHVKFAEQRAMARKVSDRFTVPICRLHHRELHRRGNERTWWEFHGIDPLKIAASLWRNTHPVVSEDANIEIERSITIEERSNGHFGNRAPGPQNYETKPILNLEAK